MELWLFRIALLIVAGQCGATLAGDAVKELWCVKDATYGERCRVGLLEAGTLSYALTLTEWVRSDHSHPFKLLSVKRFKPEAPKVKVNGKDISKIPPSLDTLSYSEDNSDFEKAVTALMEGAKEIAEEERRNTVIYFKATEAFRKMDEHELKARFAIVKRIFENLQFPIISRNSPPHDNYSEVIEEEGRPIFGSEQQFGTIDAGTEAKLGWFAAHQLAFLLEYRPLPSAVIDMGGGTVVVAQPKTNWPTAGNGIFDRERSTAMDKLTTFSTTQSFLDARAGIALRFEGLNPKGKDSLKSSDTTDGSEKIILTSYCMPEGLQQPISLDNTDFAIGSPPKSDFVKCYKAAVDYVDALIGKKVPPPKLQYSRNTVLIGQFFVIGNHAHAVKRKWAALNHNYTKTDPKDLLSSLIIRKGDEKNVKEVDHFTLEVDDFLSCAVKFCHEKLSENDQRGGWRCVDYMFAYVLLRKFGLNDEVFIVDKAPIPEVNALTESEMKVSWGSGFLLEFVAEQSRNKETKSP